MKPPVFPGDWKARDQKLRGQGPETMVLLADAQTLGKMELFVVRLDLDSVYPRLHWNRLDKQTHGLNGWGWAGKGASPP